MEMKVNPANIVEKKEADKMEKSIATIMTVKNNVAYWTTNNAVVPQDIAEFAKFLGYNIDLAAQRQARQNETSRALDNYIANPPQITSELQAEMDATFGNTKTIDIILGR